MSFFTWFEINNFNQTTMVIINVHIVFQILVLKYVSNRDVFMRFHKSHLARRLILDTSADNEMEENMVEGLRVSVGEARREGYKNDILRRKI